MKFQVDLSEAQFRGYYNKKGDNQFIILKNSCNLFGDLKNGSFSDPIIFEFNVLTIFLRYAV